MTSCCACVLLTVSWQKPVVCSSADLRRASEAIVVAWRGVSVGAALRIHQRTHENIKDSSMPDDVISHSNLNTRSWLARSIRLIVALHRAHTPAAGGPVACQLSLPFTHSTRETMVILMHGHVGVGQHFCTTRSNRGREHGSSQLARKHTRTRVPPNNCELRAASANSRRTTFRHANHAGLPRTTPLFSFKLVDYINTLGTSV